MKYRFSVFASNIYGNGANSVEFIFGTISVPGLPTGLTLLRATGSCLKISWTAPNDGGSTI
jgi:hypothetical protein